MKLLDERMGIRLKTREYPVIPTGITRLDDFLFGGFRKDSIIQFYGTPGSGRTTVAMQIAANIMKQQWRSIWLDCNGAFSVRRFAQLLGDRELLKKVSVVRLRSPSHLTQILEMLKQHMDRVGVIVVDPLTYFYRADWSRVESQGIFHELITKHLSGLAGTAKFWKIPVIVINYATLTNYGAVRPLAKNAFQKMDRYRFCFTTLTKPENDPPTMIYQLEVEKAPDTASQGKKLPFIINGSGAHALDPTSLEAELHGHV